VEAQKLGSAPSDFKVKEDLEEKTENSEKVF